MIDMNTNKIGVIIPVYNVEPYLHRCIDSILAQTYKNIQIILVDDGSTDNSGKICDEYATQDDRIVVIHQKNQGQSVARNAGLDYLFANTDCEYINFVDSDDWIHPSTLAVLLKALREKQVDVSVCGFQRTYGEEIEVSDNLQVQLWAPEEFYAKGMMNSVISVGKLYRKACFDAIRFPIGQMYGEDAFVTNRILFQYKEIAFIDAPLYAYFQNPNSVTLSRWTPVRLSSIDELFDQMAFFEARHLDKAKNSVVPILLWQLSTQLLLAEKSGYMKESVYLRNLLRKQIRKYKRLCNLSPGKTCDLYEAAYPRLMKLYWYGIAALKKLH